MTETDHTNVMEAGSLIPAPGHEHEWFEENRARLAESEIRAVRNARDIPREAAAS
ncbi:MAG TPA: hypothetical protein VG327_16195 [Mycobacterium sp.]|nr:hypothetical protein [Mycobacterium sp.]